MNVVAFVMLVVLGCLFFIGYPIGVTIAVARIAYRARGVVAGLAAAVATLAAWWQAPLITFAGSIPALFVAWWLDHYPRVLAPAFPRAKVV